MYRVIEYGLRLGFTVLSTDLDCFWLANPFKYLADAAAEQVR